MVVVIKTHAYPCATQGLEPKLLHAVMVMLIVTTVAADATDINMMQTFLVLVMLNVMVMRMLMVTTLAMMWLMLQVQT